MDLNSLLQPSPVVFQWVDGPKGPKVIVHDLWAEITTYPNGTAHCNVSNKYGMAGAPYPSVATAKAEAEGMIRSIIDRRIKEAIKTLETYCILEKETASCAP